MAANNEAINTLDLHEGMADEGDVEEGARAVESKAPDGFYTSNGEEAGSSKPLLGALFMVALLAVLLVVGLLYKVNDTPLSRAIVEPPSVSSNETFAPSFSPTEFPTVHPTTKIPTTSPPTESPSPFPTTGPNTFPPTFEPPPGGPKSPQDCFTIRNVNANVTGGGRAGNNFNNYTMWDGSIICGDTFGGFDRQFPDRSVWAADIGRRDCVLLGFTEGAQMCALAGARRCTADEIQQGVATASGCGGDFDFLYSSTSCKTDDGTNGKLQVNFARRVEGVFFKCEPDFENFKTITRCCGDPTL